MFDGVWLGVGCAWCRGGGKPTGGDGLGVAAVRACRMRSGDGYNVPRYVDCNGCVVRVILCERYRGTINASIYQRQVMRAEQ